MRGGVALPAPSSLPRFQRRLSVGEAGSLRATAPSAQSKLQDVSILDLPFFR